MNSPDRVKRSPRLWVAAIASLGALSLLLHHAVSTAHLRTASRADTESFDTRTAWFLSSHVDASNGAAMLNGQPVVGGMPRNLGEGLLHPELLSVRGGGRQGGGTHPLTTPAGSEDGAAATQTADPQAAPNGTSPRPFAASLPTPTNKLAGTLSGISSQPTPESPCPGPIPRLLHQSYLGGRQQLEAAANEPLTHFRRDWWRSCQTHNPGWQYMLWDRPAAEQLLAQRYAWFLPLFHNLSSVVLQADALRVFVLHAYGGVYLDLDTECLKPLGPSLEAYSLVLQAEEGHLANNAQMASVAGHPFWQLMQQRAGAAAGRGELDPLYAAGPHALTAALREYLGTALPQVPGTYPDPCQLPPALGEKNSSMGGSVTLPVGKSDGGGVRRVRVYGPKEWFTPCTWNDADCQQRMARAKAFVRRRTHSCPLTHQQQQAVLPPTPHEQQQQQQGEVATQPSSNVAISAAERRQQDPTSTLRLGSPLQPASQPPQQAVAALAASSGATGGSGRAAVGAAKPLPAPAAATLPPGSGPEVEGGEFAGLVGMHHFSGSWLGLDGSKAGWLRDQALQGLERFFSSKSAFEELELCPRLPSSLPLSPPLSTSNPGTPPTSSTSKTALGSTATHKEQPQLQDQQDHQDQQDPQDRRAQLACLLLVLERHLLQQAASLRQASASSASASHHTGSAAGLKQAAGRPSLAVQQAAAGPGLRAQHPATDGKAATASPGQAGCRVLVVMESGALLGKGATGAGPGPWAADQIITATTLVQQAHLLGCRVTLITDRPLALPHNTSCLAGQPCFTAPTNLLPYPTTSTPLLSTTLPRALQVHRAQPAGMAAAATTAPSTANKDFRQPQPQQQQERSRSAMGSHPHDHRRLTALTVSGLQREVDDAQGHTQQDWHTPITLHALLAVREALSVVDDPHAHIPAYTLASMVRRHGPQASTDLHELHGAGNHRPALSLLAILSTTAMGWQAISQLHASGDPLLVEQPPGLLLLNLGALPPHQHHMLHALYQQLYQEAGFVGFSHHATLMRGQGFQENGNQTFTSSHRLDLAFSQASLC